MNSPHRPSPSRRFPIWWIVGGFAIFDFLAPIMMEGMGPANVGPVLVRLIAGTIAAQLVLLSIWAAVGPLPALVRLPLTMMVGMLLAACLVAGNVVLDGLGGLLERIAAEFPFLPLFFLVTQLPLWGLRLITGGRIVRIDPRTGQVPLVQGQFTIANLMGAMVVVALALGLATYGGPVDGTGVFASAVICMGSCLLSVFVALPCLGAGLGAKTPRAGAVGLAIYAGVMVLLLLLIVFLGQFDGGGMPLAVVVVDTVVMLLSFVGTLAFVTLGTLYGARACGYRYQRGGRRLPVAATGSPVAEGHEISTGMQEAQRPTDGSPADRGEES